MNIKINYSFSLKRFLGIVLFLVSALIGSLLYLGYFINMLPRFFNNMENIEKNILAYIIIIWSVYTFMKILFRIDKQMDGYILLCLYFVVLLFGLLRQGINYSIDSSVSWNPFGFMLDIHTNEASFYVMLINLIIFMPMYFLLAYTNVFNSFYKRLIFFEIFIVLIEFTQYEFNIGVLDLSDILLYNIGFFVGFVFALILLKILKSKKKRTQIRAFSKI